jgi:hypothetical protein
MNSDIKLDAESDGWVTIESNVLKANSSDFMLDNSARRKSTDGFRRALVHNENDGLTVNFNGDYPGGVRLEGDVRIEGDARIDGDASVEGGLTVAGRLRLRKIDSPDNALPRKGNVGEIIVLQNSTINPAALLNDVSVWICLGKRIGTGEDDNVWWQQISVGEPLAGTVDN